MKVSALTATLITVALFLFFAQETKAQAITGLTLIDYDEASNTVDAYSETDLDYNVAYDYDAYVLLQVWDQNGALIRSQSARDNYQSSSISVEFLFQGTPDATYTARGTHKAYAAFYDYDYVYPYQIFYYDDWHFGYFEGQGIYVPWYYYFYRNAFQQVTRRNRYINLGTTYDYDSVATPGLSVTMSSAQSIKDGETAPFSVTASGGTPSSYQWSFTAPSGSANSPSVTFSPNGSSSTTTDGHWFANPNDTCGAGRNASYSIKCNLIFSNGKKKSGQTTLTVSVIFSSSGEAGVTANPTIGGGPTYGFDTSRNLWVVINAGTMSRQAPAVTIYAPQNSQFYQKAVTHENKHVDQYQTGMLSDLYTVSSLFAQLSPLTDTTEQGLINQINSTTLNWYASQGSILGTRRRAAEQEAHGVSDPIAPMYIYQWQCVSSLYP